MLGARDAAKHRLRIAMRPVAGRAYGAYLPGRA